jgi:hypothetical protein
MSRVSSWPPVRRPRIVDEQVDAVVIVAELVQRGLDGVVEDHRPMPTGAMPC